MIKAIKHIDGGSNSAVGDYLVNRLLPEHDVQAVGPIVFLDHLYPTEVKSDASTSPDGSFAHPHRGIATFSYVFEGGLSHYDSQGNFNQIGAGGIQWMKAGRGIIHDELPYAVTPDRKFHSLQFWINLPSAIKQEAPDYMAVQAADVPEVELPGNNGKLRVLLGDFGCTSSLVKTYSPQFIYHLKLNPKSAYHLPVKTGMEYAAFVPSEEVFINGDAVGKSKITIFEDGGDEIEFRNPNIAVANVLVFGGAPYGEAIVSRGPFVMNTHGEIATAYRDFFDGKYGHIIYPKQ
jgi:redox-sensitive bicupin YhaK (pirin superfamily)